MKDRRYGGLAEVAKALANPKRLELVDLLVQRPLHVEALADAIANSVGNTSQHLQVLRRARVVETVRHGTSVEYRLAPGVAEVLVVLRRLAEARSPDLQLVRRDLDGGDGAADVIDGPTLRRRLAEGDVVLVDVRPHAEFAHRHVAGARSMPLSELVDRLDELPRDTLIVATCRGPYCTWAVDAVRVLRAAGRRAVWFEDGVAEWQADGGAVAQGA